MQVTTSEIAAKIVDLIKASTYRAKEQKMIRAWNDRVYLVKGYLRIREDGSIDTSSIVGIAYSKAIAAELRAAGFNVPVQRIAGGIEI